MAMKVKDRFFFGIPVIKPGSSPGVEHKVFINVAFQYSASFLNKELGIQANFVFIPIIISSLGRLQENPQHSK